jgi:hypothetical protein
MVLVTMGGNNPTNATNPTAGVFHHLCSRLLAHLEPSHLETDGIRSSYSLTSNVSFRKVHAVTSLLLRSISSWTRDCSDLIS